MHVVPFLLNLLFYRHISLLLDDMKQYFKEEERRIQVGCPKHSACSSTSKACNGCSKSSRPPWYQRAMADGPVNEQLGPFLYWRNVVDISKSRRCRTKIEPEMLDLLEVFYITFNSNY